jgi:hypothetical protein
MEGDQTLQHSNISYEGEKDLNIKAANIVKVLGM